MRKRLLLISGLLAGEISNAQIDTSSIENLNNALDNVPVQVLDATEMANGNENAQPSLLFGSRDAFFNISNFNLNVARFKIRGYDNNWNIVSINGLPIKDMETGTPMYTLWSGLNDFFRNQEPVLHLRNSDFSFGNIGVATNLNTAVLSSKPQDIVGYALSNRTYRHRVNVLHNSGSLPNGWEYRLGGTLRYSGESYIPGTYYQGGSYFASVEKQLDARQTIGLNIFGNITENGRQIGATLETMELAGTKYYNPSWGWQNGKKRNANVSKQHIPVLLLFHHFQINRKSDLQTAFSFMSGNKSYSNLEWYNAPDPRPDYYRYLPSYYSNDDPEQAAALKYFFQNNPDRLQIDWQQLYTINSSSANLIDSLHRSLYIVADRVNHIQSYNAATTFNAQMSERILLTSGLRFQAQQNHNYQQVKDLLGGDYWLNVNQYAQRDFPYSDIAIQYDVDNPNRKIKENGKYGYDYSLKQFEFSEWLQLVFTLRKIDFFVASELGYRQMQRIGKVRNGLFPEDSYGASEAQKFIFVNAKAGLTYKLDGRNYFFVNAALIQRPPNISNIFISPRTRNAVNGNVQNETVQTVEGGYKWNTEKIRMRLEGYLTQFKNGMEVRSFYDDYFNSFVNYSLSNIDKIHFGGELGIEYNLHSNLVANAMAAVGRYYYNSRQSAIVTSDNRADILTRQIVYVKNYRVASTPQNAYSAGLNYRSPHYWAVSVSANYWDNAWLPINPLRRTALATEDFNQAENPELWNKILDQQKLKGNFTLNLFSSYYWKLKSNKNLLINLGVNNLLNNKNIQSGGYEQLRFDVKEYNVEKFPPKYFYALGLNYFLSIGLRF